MGLDEFFEDEFKESGFRRTNTRSAEWVEFIVFCSTIGVFTGLWNVFKLIRESRKSVVFKISYMSGSKKIDVTIENLNRKDFDELSEKYPPNLNEDIVIKIDEN